MDDNLPKLGVNYLFENVFKRHTLGTQLRDGTYSVVMQYFCLTFGFI